MIGSIMDYYLSIDASSVFTFLVANESVESPVFDSGALKEIVDTNKLDIKMLWKCASRGEYSSVVLMGADGLDGTYNQYFSITQLILIDIFSRYSYESVITGFSVSNKIHFFPRIFFRYINKNIRINLRDPESYSRFTAKAGVQAHSVVDIAFLLQPMITDEIRSTLNWIANSQSKGRKVIVLNAHPLLLEQRGKLTKLIEHIAHLVLSISKKEEVSWLLLSHDDRGDSADAVVLSPLYELLRRNDSLDIVYDKNTFSAREVKAIVSEVDGVITGRMHLMIACVGMSTPVLGIEYKDKMKGLLDVVGFGANFLIDANMILTDHDKCVGRVLDFFNSMTEYKESLIGKHDDILRGSRENFED